jgi:hypothetical protein
MAEDPTLLPEVACPPPVQSGWPNAVKWIAIVLIMVAGGLYVFQSCRNLPMEVVQKSSKAWADIASAFRTGTITTSFVSYATTLTNTQYLQFATLKQTELFARTEEMTTAFGYLPLPEVIVEARAPVEYTYYLDLKGKWQFILRDKVIYVLAPAIRFNKPSVDASAISYEVKRGYLKTAEAQENLKKSITSLAALKAKENIGLVREAGRRQTAEFVEQWLMRSFTDGERYAVKVFFADEKASLEPEKTALRLLEP